MKPRKLQSIFLLALICLTFTGCNGAIAHELNHTSKEGNQDLSDAVLESEEEILSSLLFAMQNNQETCTFMIKDKSMIDVDSWLIHLPGLYGVHCTYITMPKHITVRAKLQYWDNYPISYAYKTGKTNILNERQLALYDKYCSILNQYTSVTKSPIQNELAIHDYIVNNVTYTPNTSNNAAYDALFSGTAVCMGYAECFQTFMDMLGIECIPVTGIADGEPHIWNLVSLDNEWYHVDVTWDDPIGDDERAHYSYFNVTDEDILLDHTIDSDKLPSCLGTKYSYYNVLGYEPMVSQNDLNAFVKEKTKVRAGKLYYKTSRGANLDLRKALEQANMSISYQFSITERPAYSTYEVEITYK